MLSKSFTKAAFWLRHRRREKTAILVDLAFYLKRKRIAVDADVTAVVAVLVDYCLAHVQGHRLHGIYAYDCPPLTKNVRYPVSGKNVCLAQTPSAIFRQQVHRALAADKKVDVKMGRLCDNSAQWIISNKKIYRAVMSGRQDVKDLSDDCFTYYAPQKEVDMKIGMDIARLVYCRQVSQIVLISGDSDFASAAKVARDNGVNFLLDPMGLAIRAELLAQVDGLQTPSKNATSKLPR